MYPVNQSHFKYFRSLPEEDADRALMTMSPFEPARQQQQAEVQQQQQEQQPSPMESENSNVSRLCCCASRRMNKIVFRLEFNFHIFRLSGLFQSWRQTKSEEQFRLRFRVDEHNQRECRQFVRQSQRECRQFVQQSQREYRRFG